MQRIDDISIATMVSGANDFGLISNGAIVFDKEKIAWVGKASECPAEFMNVESHGFEGRLLTPALIDCHTHLVFGGNRADETEMRLNGASYKEIADAGGGIVSTVSATREQSQNELLEPALKRVDALMRQGVSTIEVKSGYGLDVDTELKMLRVARKIATLRPVHIVTTFLGAHAAPSGMNADRYIDEVCIPTLIKANKEGLVDAVDAFCESIGFNAEQISRVFTIAAKLKLPLKLHAEQLSNSGGIHLATRFNALSADHIEYASQQDVTEMAEAGTVAVLLPGAFYTLRETQKPPVETLRKHGVPMAVGTDWNPGSSPLGSLLLAMNMACTLFELTPQEALAGTTRHAALALGFHDRGKIKVGLRADFAIWDASSPAELSYHIGFNTLHKRVFGGYYD